MALPGVGREEAACIAERLRQHIAAASLEFGPGRIEMTVSIGLTSLLPADCSIEQIVARADALLYSAKNTGRNRVMSDMPALAA